MKSSRPFTRHTGKLGPSLVPRKTLLIVCEGEKTEPYYFKSFRKELKLSSIEIEVVGKECGSAPISVVDYAVKRKKERQKSCIYAPFDTIWCIMDVETTPHPTLDQALNKAEGNKLNVALSNPAFEYWLLVHFDDVSHSFQVYHLLESRLKKHLKDYYKGNSSIFDKLYPNTDRAISFSKLLEKQSQWGRNLKYYNPSTHVYKVIEELIQISKQKPYKI